MSWRWEPTAEPFEVDGMCFRVVAEEQAQSNKRKGNGHVVLQWNSHDGWREVTMPQAFVMSDFFYNEEDHMYPPTPDGRIRGGWMFLHRCQVAALQGWEYARDRLKTEIAKKNGKAQDR